MIFTIDKPEPGDKWFAMTGAGIEVRFDFDDVDPFTVEKTAERIAEILNENWRPIDDSNETRKPYLMARGWTEEEFDEAYSD